MNFLQRFEKMANMLDFTPEQMQQSLNNIDAQKQQNAAPQGQQNVAPNGQQNAAPQAGAQPQPQASVTKPQAGAQQNVPPQGQVPPNNTQTKAPEVKKDVLNAESAAPGGSTNANQVSGGQSKVQIVNQAPQSVDPGAAGKAVNSVVDNVAGKVENAANKVTNAVSNFRVTPGAGAAAGALMGFAGSDEDDNRLLNAGVGAGAGYLLSKHFGEGAEDNATDKKLKGTAENKGKLQKQIDKRDEIIKKLQGDLKSVSGKVKGYNEGYRKGTEDYRSSTLSGKIGNFISEGRQLIGKEINSLGNMVAGKKMDPTSFLGDESTGPKKPAKPAPQAVVPSGPGDATASFPRGRNVVGNFVKNPASYDIFGMSKFASVEDSYDFLSRFEKLASCEPMMMVLDTDQVNLINRLEKMAAPSDKLSNAVMANMLTDPLDTLDDNEDEEQNGYMPREALRAKTAGFINEFTRILKS